MAPQSIFSQPQLDAGVTKLRAPYSGELAPAQPVTPSLRLTPWLVGGAVLGGVLYLLFRD